MRIFFACLSLVSGCALSHGSEFDAFVPMDDASPMIEPDAGRVTELDAGIDSDPVVDAAPMSGLLVRLSPETPAARVVPRDSTGVRLATFDFEGAGTSATILTLAIRRTGIGAASDFENVYLFDEYGRRLTTGRTINAMSNIVMFNGLSVVVSEARVKSLTLVGDLGDPVTTGGQHAFEIVDMSAVLTDGVAVTGDFPIRSAVTTVGLIRATTVTCAKGPDLPDPEVGTSSDISNFSLTTGERDVELRRLTLLQAGSIDNTNLTELGLYQGSALVAYTSFVSVDRVVFQFPLGLLLPTSSATAFTVRARVRGPVGRTIRLYVEYPADIEALDVELRTPARVHPGSFNGFEPRQYSEVTTR